MYSSPMYPAQVYAQFTGEDRKSSRNDRSFDMDKNKNNRSTDSGQSTHKMQDFIHVQESGQVTLPPDIAKVTIVCSNTKDTAEEVKISVTRRVEYILQTLRSHTITNKYYTVDRCLRRKEKQYYYRVEIIVCFTDFNKCQEISNFLVEKLDISVDISSPQFEFEPGKIESLRRQSCLLAVHNAKMKAVEIANSLHQSLGQARQIHEESTEELTGFNTDDIKCESDTYQQLLKSATVTVLTKISVSFELKGRVRKKV